jgi:hypothetical protein
LTVAKFNSKTRIKKSFSVFSADFESVEKVAETRKKKVITEKKKVDIGGFFYFYFFVKKFLVYDFSG